MLGKIRKIISRRGADNITRNSPSPGGTSETPQNANQRTTEHNQTIKDKNRTIKTLRQRLAKRDARIAALRTDVLDANDPGDQERIVNLFHKLYYDSSKSGGTWQDTFWMGVPVWKCPLDLWIYQEILFDQKPDVIVETGTAFGGSALFMASVCGFLDNGEVVTVDIKDREGRPQHERIQYITGSSTDEKVVEQVRQRADDAENVLIILDSDHRKLHVDHELEIYSQLIREGNYLIVEDSNINGHPVRPDFGPGPMEALEEFLEKNESFVIDENKEKFYMTFNPKGFLKKTGRA